ncbi:hypothetical protein K461DRAFT_284955 [Myriangium duriaei CBS 260.36]|uniref:Mitochondrial ATPase complex subunit ATP10 n=1 Tax=Myriangium duriaei CBS 260.36 TaxID=1168546 RepID=A0A9P4J7H3_9PEZI|nr:hypothetical protein K461DRAFT_284955 [Myriangium duriaei CBS 260.36]
MFAPSVRCLRALRSITSLDQTPRPCTTYIRFYATNKPSKPLPSPANSAPAQITPTKPPPQDEFLDPSKETRAEGPRFLNRPLGVPTPPHAGQNLGKDTRTLRQRRDDFVNHDKHLQRRQKLAKELFRPYFKDFNDMRYFKGKVFFAPDRIFKAQFARYFPNLRGTTLEGKEADTTDVLVGNVSVVTLSSSGWGENQVKSFCDEKENPGLGQFLDHIGSAEGGKKLAQLVEINYEPNTFKHWLIKLFIGRLKAMKEQFRWGRYFVVHKGFDQELRQAVGMSNQKVGHVYLVDAECRIRWAGHALADEQERTSMVKNLNRLLTEHNNIPKQQLPAAETQGEELLEKPENKLPA